MVKPRILILSFSPIARDPRVMRQIGLLVTNYALTVAGYGPSPSQEIGYVCLDYAPAKRRRFRRLRWELQLAAGMFESYYWSRPEARIAVAATKGTTFDLVIANDIVALPLGLEIAKNAPLLLDAHEYSPTEFEDKLLWRLRYGRLYRHICVRHLPEAAATTTVCAGVAQEYRRNFGVNPVVVENAPPFQSLLPRAPTDGRVRMIHHGAAIRSRRLELMIEVMQHLEQRFSLDFMLVANDQQYVAELQSRAAGDSRIRFLPPVPMPDICRATNEYDVGLFLLPPTNFNYRFALPNKLFEFIQARLAVAIGPSPEMARVVKAHDLGIIASSFDAKDLADRLNAMTQEDLMRYKTASHRAAKQLCFESVSGRLLSLINHLLCPDRPADAAS
jgi:hypothetical protein